MATTTATTTPIKDRVEVPSTPNPLDVLAAKNGVAEAPLDLTGAKYQLAKGAAPVSVVTLTGRRIQFTDSYLCQFGDEQATLTELAKLRKDLTRVN